MIYGIPVEFIWAMLFLFGYLYGFVLNVKV